MILKRDEGNRYSDVAVAVLRENGKQIGHVPEYLAERIDEETAAGKQIVAFVTTITGGSWTKPTRGVNFAVFFAASDVGRGELSGYVSRTLAEAG